MFLAKKPAIDSDEDSEDEAIRKKRKSDFLKDSEAEEDDSDEEVSAPKKKKTKTADDDEDDDEDDENAEDADEDGNIKGLIASSDGEVADSDDDGSHRNVLPTIFFIFIFLMRFWGLMIKKQLCNAIIGRRKRSENVDYQKSVLMMMIWL